MRQPRLAPLTSIYAFLPEALPISSWNFRARLIATEDKGTTVSRVASPKPSVNGASAEKVIIDPTKGGAVSPKVSQQSKALDVKPGFWVWDGVVKILEVDLFSAAWEVRHGAAMALRELLKIQGKFGGMRGSTIHLLFNGHFYSLSDRRRIGTRK